MKKSLLLFTLFLISIPFLKSQVEYFVAPSGQDHQSGTIESPFATIEKALAMGLSQEKQGSISIYLRAGIYEIRNTIQVQGVNQHVSITAYSNEAVILTGGKYLDLQNVQPVKGSQYEDLFKNSIVQNIFMVDLKKEGIDEYHRLKNVGYAKSYKVAGMELFKDDVPGQIARWPNDSTILITDLLDGGLFPKEENDIPRGGKIKYNIPNLPKWNSLKDVWIEGYFHHGYALDAVRIKEIDYDQKTITTIDPHIYGFIAGQDWNRFYAYNIPEELDLEEEYYIGREKGILFFYQADKTHSLEVSILEKPFFSIINSNHIQIKNITFQAARGIGIYLENSSHCSIRECTFKNLGSLAIWFGKAPLNKKEQISSENILGNNPDSYTFDRNKCDEGTDNKIEYCKIFQTGAGGIWLSGGNRYDLTPANNQVNHCEIFDFNRIEKSFRPAITLNGVGHKISHCEIYDGLAHGIVFTGNNHIIEYNDIYDVCLDVEDAGAIYYGRNPSQRGTTIRHNYFHHIGGETAYLTSAIYHDDGSSGMEVYGNIFLKAGSIAVFIGGGSDISYRNNLFINCPTAIHIDDRLNNWFSSLLESGGVFEKKLNEIAYNKPPYSIQYPNLAKYWEGHPSKPKRNVFSSNIFCEIGSLSNTGIKLLDWKDNNVSSSGYPSIWKKSMDDRNFIPNDMYLPKPLNWKEIEKEKIGIQVIKVKE